MTSNEVISGLRSLAASMEAEKPDHDLAWKLAAWMVGWVTGSSNDTIAPPDVVEKVGKLISESASEGP